MTEKVEGFFEICKIKGLTGSQGVLIPLQNVGELALNDEVIAAVSQDRFHIYPVSTVDQGIEILSGTAAGREDKKGNYPAASVHGRVMAKLASYHKAYTGKTDSKGRRHHHKKKEPTPPTLM